MTLVFTTTRQASALHGIKSLAHGRSGVGKTTLVGTLADTFPTVLLSAESGVLSIGHLDIPQITIRSFLEMEEAYQFIAFSQQGMQFQAVALDSISEIAELCLGGEKAMTKDGRRAYGEMHDKMLTLIKKYRDLPGRHVYFSAKQGSVKDEVTNVTKYGPDMPGQQLSKDLPYLFDEVFSLDVFRAQDGSLFRALRTQTDVQFDVKDRSGVLAPFEEPHLGKLINKILAAKKAA